MPINYPFLFLLCVASVAGYSQEPPRPDLNIGDPAPAMLVREWIKGEPVKAFEKGQIYVVEFWATWCQPCKAAMPRLSALAHQYNGKVKFIGMDIMEMPNTKMKEVRAFVEKMGDKMDYTVAAQDSDFMATGWLVAAGVEGIPKTFIINEEGKIAWIGHPAYLDTILPRIVNQQWNVHSALAQADMNRHLEFLDREASYDLMNFGGNFRKQDYIGKPDSVLLMIHAIVTREPQLRYAPLMVGNTLAALFKTDFQQAYAFGKVAMVTTTYEEPPYYMIVRVIEMYAEHLNLPPEIYQLGAEACQADMDHFPYPELLNYPKRYQQLAKMYWGANDKGKAIDAQQKAIAAFRQRNDTSATKLAALETRLNEYKAVK